MAGRPKTLELDKLKAIVRQYQRENIGKKIMVADLVRYSSISKNTWYRNQEILAYIKQANFAPLLIKAQERDIPSEHDIIKSCGNDIDKYKDVVHMLLDTIDLQNRELVSLKKSTEGITYADVETLNKKVAEYEKIISKLLDKLNFAISEKDKLINIKDNMDKTDISTFSSQFGELFE